MFRRFIFTTALVASAAAYVAAFAAPERATFILTNGERKSGTVVFHGSSGYNLIDEHLNLAVDAGQPEYTVPVSQVAVIDFAGGQPSNTELNAVSATGQSLALRNGTVEQGRFVNILNGSTVRWESNGNSRDIPISDVSRIYLNPSSAFTAYNFTRSGSAVGTTGTALAPGAVQVNANQQWNATGVIVRRGDMVRFSTTGTVQFGNGPEQTAPPDGNDKIRNPAFPVPQLPVGALIGRVGNSQPFSIGSNAAPIQMPAAGTLMLGVNDNEYGDNSGFFSVVVSKQ